MCVKLGGLIIKVEPMWTIFQYTNSITDTSAKMGSNVIGDHKIHLNMATLMKKKGVLLLAHFCFEVWVLYGVFSISCITSFGDRTRPQHQQTTKITIKVTDSCTTTT